MRAAMLTDLVARVEAAIDKYQTLAIEEEEARQKFNQEAEQHTAKLEEQLTVLREERDSVQADQDEGVAERREALAAARMKLAEQLAINNMPMQLRNWGLGDDPDVFAKSPAIGQEETVLAQKQETTDLLPSTGAPSAGSQTWFDRLTQHLSSGVRDRLRPPDGTPTGLDPQTPALLTTTDGQPVMGNSLPSRPSRQPIREEFPLHEAQQQCRPESVVALERGLPTSTPSEYVLQHKHVPTTVALWLVNVACGGIFGISVGIMLNMLSTTTMALGGPSMLRVAAVCIVFGSAVYWALGKTVQGLTALAVEEHYNSWIATHADNRAEAAQWFKRVGVMTAWVTVGSIILLVIIEANVERSGIVNLFLQQTENQAMLSGKSIIQPPSTWSIIALTLIASVPFILLHATEAWIQTRSRLLAGHASAGRDQDAWNVAKKLHADRLQEKRDIHDAEYQYALEQFEKNRKSMEAEHAEDLAERNEEREHRRQLRIQQSQPQPVAPDVPEATPEVDPQSDDDIIDATGFTVTTETEPGPRAAAAEATFDAWMRQTGLGLANESAREAYARLRDAYARRRDALQDVDQRISELKESRRQERTEPTTDERRRIEDAYSDIIGAVENFDVVFARESREYERWARGGVWGRFVGFFARPPQ
jgi:hypothetical protein